MSFLLGVAGAGLSIAGGYLGAEGARAEGNAKQQAAEANASLMEVRALEAERNRGIALDKAQMEVRDAKVKNRAMLGSIRAAYGASGLAMDGSPLDVIQATATEQELDVEKILYRGDVEAIGLTDQATSFRTQANIYRMGGNAAQIAAGYNAATSILAGYSGAVKSLASSADSAARMAA
jgi:hypothetical protein